MALTRWRPSPVVVVTVLSVVIGFIGAGQASAVLDNQTGQVTVFWGRHKDEGSLHEACDSGMYTMVAMSFLNVYGNGRYHLDLSGHPLDAIGGDIKQCQQVGVPVSLSVTSNHSLPTNQSALDLFDHLWNAYLAGSKNGVHRPFGSARLDGIDLFLEPRTPVEHYNVLARELGKHNVLDGPRTKPLHLTATPRCGFLRHHRVGGDMLATGIFEGIHVRFYNNNNDYCDEYNEEEWDKWAAAFPSTRIYLGLPASPAASKGGYGPVRFL
ncbi:hypothetical protein ACP70R_000110 [Stipagrostis hirtigluma subsp. patula]